MATPPVPPPLKLWVLLKSNDPAVINKPIKVSTKDCEDVDDFIEAVKKKLSPDLDAIAVNRISLHLTENADALRRGLGLSALPSQPGYVTNTDESPLFITALSPASAFSRKKAPKPSIPFSKATLYDCVRPDGLALNIDHVDVKVPSLHIPDDFETVSPSLWLCETLAKIDRAWVLDNEKACRIVIDAILTEVLLSESNKQLLGFCEVKNDWEGDDFCYTGTVDYMFGSCKIKSVDVIDSFLLVMEAKKEWPDSSIPQVLCEAGCLLKKRLAVGKNTPVFAALTNGLFFRFFAINTDGVVYASTTRLLEIGEDRTYNSSSSLTDILRWFTWFMTAIKSISPRASSDDLTVEMIEDSLTQLRTCFGTKNNSSKKIKI